jgi:hypothetical protein
VGVDKGVYQFCKEGRREAAFFVLAWRVTKAWFECHVKSTAFVRETFMEAETNTAPEKGWKVKRVGSAAFEISKPKRKRNQLRQSRLKNRRRAR